MNITRLASLTICLTLLFAAQKPIFAGNSGKDIEKPEARKFDVIVVGGDAEGIAAAVAAARAGGKTLLIDTRPVPGGLLTRGWLNTIDLNLNAAGRPLNGGIFGEIYRQLDDHSFDVSHMERILENLLKNQSGLEIIKDALTVLPLNSEEKAMPLFKPGQTLHPDQKKIPSNLVTTISPQLPANKRNAEISGVEVYFSDGRSKKYLCQRIIDATQDADLATAAGAASSPYGEDIWGTPRNMAVTLVFRMSGITDADWVRICSASEQQAKLAGLSGGKRKSVWGFGETMQKFTTTSAPIKMRGLNLGRQNDGSVLVNALLIFHVDGLSVESRLKARQMAEAELPNIMAYMKKNVAGLERAEIAGTAPELYVRTSRQISTLYCLSVDDVLENRDFFDRVGFGSYPLDIQAQSPDHPGDVTGNPEQYAIPLRSLVPVGFSNLLVVGRSAGFDSLAQSSARTVPVGMAAGQGAGVAAWVSIRRNMKLQDFAANPTAIEEMQRILVEQHVALTSNPARPPGIIEHWAYAGLKFMRRRGQISGSYQNEYNLNRPIGSLSFVNRVVNLHKRLDKAGRQKIYEYAAGNKADFTLLMACEVLAMADHAAEMTHNDASTKEKVQVIFSSLRQSEMFRSIWPADQKEANSVITRGSAYMFLLHFFGE